MSDEDTWNPHGDRLDEDAWVCLVSVLVAHGTIHRGAGTDRSMRTGDIVSSADLTSRCEARRGFGPRRKRAFARRPSVIPVTSVASVLLLLSTPAQAFTPALVVDVGFRHAPHAWTLALQESGLLVVDGRTVEGASGGGLAVAAIGHAWWLRNDEWAVEARVRVLAAHDAILGFVPEVPIDLLGRMGFGLVHGRNRLWNGWPSYVREYSPFVPHFGLGATVDFAPTYGNVRAGPMSVAGFTWWVAYRAGILVEIEARALFGGGGPLGQFGVSLGTRAGL